MPGTTASTSQDRTGPGRVLAAWGGNQLWPRCVCVKPGGGGVGGGLVSPTQTPPAFSMRPADTGYRQKLQKARLALQACANGLGGLRAGFAAPRSVSFPLSYSPEGQGSPC